MSDELSRKSAQDNQAGEATDERMIGDESFLDLLRSTSSPYPNKDVIDGTPQPSPPIPKMLPRPKAERNKSFKRPPSVSGHQRNISTASSVESLQMPSLHRRNESAGGLQFQQSRRKLSVDEMLTAISPFEDEAEKAILKAIDNRQKRNLGREASTSILSGVPDSASHNFEDTTSLTSPGSLNNKDTSKDDDENADNESMDGSTRSTTRQTAPLLQRAPSVQHLSVEDTLSHLTMAMTALHGTRHRRTKTSDSNTTSHDALVHNAEILHENHQQQGLFVVQEASIPVGSVAATDETKEQGDSDGYTTTNGDIAYGNNDDIESGRTGSQRMVGKRKKGKRKNVIREEINKEWQLWTDFIRPKRERLRTYIKVVTLYLLIPMVTVAAILFYAVDNPPTGVGQPANNRKASVSFILLFCVRQIITLSLSLAMQALVIDFLALGTKIMLSLVGPIITLVVVQSKGWPQVLFWWSILDFCMLSGDRPFSSHWLFYQDGIRMFNESNPSGDIVNNGWYIRILAISLCLSFVVAVKRFLVGLYLGRQTFSYYGQPLAQTISKMLHISEVAKLAKDIEDAFLDNDDSDRLFQFDNDKLNGLMFADEEEEDGSVGDMEPHDVVIDPNKRDLLTGSLKYSEKLKLMQLLDAWEEPVRHDDPSANGIASISAVLRFRKALAFIQKNYPFSRSFGPADDRETCIESAQEVYHRLLKASSDVVLRFDVLARLAVDDHGNIDQVKAKTLIKLFRPDRQGNLTLVDFVKSVDEVYKEFRMLAATIENSSQIDHAFERMFNVVFYFAAGLIILSQLGFDPLALFLSLSSVIVAFAFAVGSSAATYFDGVMFILGRRPYGIGDRISVANPGEFQSLDGVLPWNVENVTLYETVLVYLPTNERASLSNGSLAQKMVMNWARSPQAQFHIFLKFPLNTPYEKIVLFKKAVEEYMKARPREWRALNGFRANRIMTEQNYLEFIIIIQHRDAWQNVGQVLDSKANLISYCQEVTRQLGMHYEAPRLPVDLTYSKATSPRGNDDDPDHLDTDALTKGFQTVARNKHNIFL